MKILIVYSSKAGTTKECAEEIKEYFHQEIDIVNLKDKHNLNLDSYNWIIIGTPVYAGNIEGSVKKFIAYNEQTLESKLLGFYTCGLGDDRESYDSVLKVTSLIKNAKVYKHLGGEVHPENLKGFLKVIAKMMMKNEACHKKRDKEKVKEFVDQMRNYLSGKNEESN